MRDYRQTTSLFWDGFTWAWRWGWIRPTMKPIPLSEIKPGDPDLAAAQITILRHFGDCEATIEGQRSSHIAERRGDES